MLADKVAGNLVGVWLLVPEHLRLGTWDLLGGWTAPPADDLPRRLAMQLIHESALCLTGLRQQRCLNHKGFELANGLPFVATDVAIHRVLNDVLALERHRPALVAPRGGHDDGEVDVRQRGQLFELALICADQAGFGDERDAHEIPSCGAGLL